MKHANEQTTINQATEIPGGWAIKNPVSGEILASGMNGVPRPKWVSADRDNMPKMGLNGKLY